MNGLQQSEPAPAPDNLKSKIQNLKLHRLPLRTPFAVGTVNAYLIEGGALTLVDTGPATEEAWADLEAGLAGRGYRVADIQRVLLTHGHVDHWGQAGRIAVASGAEVWAHPLLAAWLSAPAAE